MSAVIYNFAHARARATGGAPGVGLCRICRDWDPHVEHFPGWLGGCRAAERGRTCADNLPGIVSEDEAPRVQPAGYLPARGGAA